MEFTVRHRVLDRIQQYGDVGDVRLTEGRNLLVGVRLQQLVQFGLKRLPASGESLLVGIRQGNSRGRHGADRFGLVVGGTICDCWWNRAH